MKVSVIMGMQGLEMKKFLLRLPLRILFVSKQTLIVALSSSRGERIVDLSFANDVFSLFSIHAYATEPIKPALY